MSENLIKDYIEQNDIEVEIGIEDKEGNELTKHEIKQNPILLAKYYSVFFSEFKVIYDKMEDKTPLKGIYESNQKIFEFIYGQNALINSGSIYSSQWEMQLMDYVLENYSIISNFFNQFWEVLDL